MFFPSVLTTLLTMSVLLVFTVCARDPVLAQSIVQSDDVSSATTSGPVIPSFTTSGDSASYSSYSPPSSPASSTSSSVYMSPTPFQVYPIEGDDTTFYAVSVILGSDPAPAFYLFHQEKNTTSPERMPNTCYLAVGSDTSNPVLYLVYEEIPTRPTTTTVSTTASKFRTMVPPRKRTPYQPPSYSITTATPLPLPTSPNYVSLVSSISALVSSFSSLDLAAHGSTAAEWFALPPMPTAEPPRTEHVGAFWNAYDSAETASVTSFALGASGAVVAETTGTASKERGGFGGKVDDVDEALWNIFPWGNDG